MPYLSVFKPWVAAGPDVFLEQFGFMLQSPGLLSRKHDDVWCQQSAQSNDPRLDFGDVVQSSPFETRYDWLMQRLPGRQQGEVLGAPTMSVARNSLLQSSCQRLMLLDVATLQSEFAVQFHDEAGHVRAVVVVLRAGF